MRFDLTNYNDFDAVKWLLTFTNVSHSLDSKILSQVQPGNVQLIAAQGAKERYSIHYSAGALVDGAKNDGSSSTPLAMPDFTPINNNPPRRATVTLRSVNGRSSSGVLPYFHIEKPLSGAGVIFAIGWSGGWLAQLAVDGTGTNLRFTAGQQDFNAQLRPTESTRTPAILMMKWTGSNWLVGQNKFRQLMLTHFSPHYENRTLPKSVAAGSYAFGSRDNHTSSDLIKAVHAIHNAGLALNTFWEDTGWFPLMTREADPSLFAYLTRPEVDDPRNRRDDLWESGAGDWIADKQRFPADYAEISDSAHSAGMKSLLWFEPERVSVPAKNYSIFASQRRLLQSVLTDPNAVKIFRLYNLSDQNNVDLMARLIDSQIKIMHLDIFRQDMNGDGPLPDWQQNDRNQSSNMAGIARSGMTEAGYIAGLYDFWDQLRSNNPKLLIDNCASGGRRLDFEALSRTVPLWRSDRVWDPIEQQNQMLGLSLWLPLQGRGSDSVASPAELKYKIRSGYGWNGTYAFPWGRPIGPAILSLLRIEINRLYGTASPLRGAIPLAEIFKGDYYPMSYTQVPPIGNWDGSMPSWVNDDVWVGWQFYRPDLQIGLVQGFRRSIKAPAKFVFYPHGLTLIQRYLISNLDTNAQQHISGRALMIQGITMDCISTNSSFCTGLFTIQAEN